MTEKKWWYERYEPEGDFFDAFDTREEAEAAMRYDWAHMSIASRREFVLGAEDGTAWMLVGCADASQEEPYDGLDEVTLTVDDLASEEDAE